MPKKKTTRARNKTAVQRISVSLPEHLAVALDRMVSERGFHNRSQAISEMIQERVNAHHQEDDDMIMAGTITLFYDSTKPGLLQKLKRVQRDHIDEVISTHNVLLEGNHIMEVVLVQGPIKNLRFITDRMLTCKGVSSGELTLTSKIMPPVHGR
jgi:CopG family nickel-responsive transcriptional regulator